MNQKDTGHDEIQSIKVAIRKGIADKNVSLAEVSSQLGMSQRTVQRRLADSGLTFRRVLSEVRVAIAEGMLADGERVGDIAAKLNYTSRVSINALFERERSMQPKEVRRMKKMMASFEK